MDGWIMLLIVVATLGSFGFVMYLVHAEGAVEKVVRQQKDAQHPGEG